MKRWKAVLKKLLFPGWGWVVPAVLLGGVSLALTFLVFGDQTPFAYVSYVLSAYGLTVFVAAVVPLFSSAKRLIHRVPLAHRYLTDRYFKVHSSKVLSACSFLLSSMYAMPGLNWSVPYCILLSGTERWRSTTSSCALCGSI